MEEVVHQLSLLKENSENVNQRLKNIEERLNQIDHKYANMDTPFAVTEYQQNNVGKNNNAYSPREDPRPASGKQLFRKV